jgi:hypothetical protein
MLSQLTKKLMGIHEKYGDLGVCLWYKEDLFFIDKIRTYGDDRTKNLWCSLDLKTPEEDDKKKGRAL